jgi:hypothetical protein
MSRPGAEVKRNPDGTHGPEHVTDAGIELEPRPCCCDRDPETYRLALECIEVDRRWLREGYIDLATFRRFLRLHRRLAFENRPAGTDRVKVATAPPARRSLLRAWLRG